MSEPTKPVGHLLFSQWCSAERIGISDVLVQRSSGETESIHAHFPRGNLWVTEKLIYESKKKRINGVICDPGLAGEQRCLMVVTKLGPRIEVGLDKLSGSELVESLQDNYVGSHYCGDAAEFEAVFKYLYPGR